MAVTTETAITSKTVAGDSYTDFGLITIDSGNIIQVYTNVPLGAGEYITLERTPDTGVTDWFPTTDKGRRGIVLDNQSRSAKVAGPGKFKLVKSVTAVATTVYFDA